MRNLPPVLSCALLIFTASAQAQTGQAQSDYEAQKAKLKPVRFDSVAELRVVARNYLGKNIELKGQVKGIFARGESLAVLFQVAEGDQIVIEAPLSLRESAMLKPGALGRVLCRVDGTAGTEIALSLVDATTAPETGQLFRTDDADEIVVAPPGGAFLPQPDQIMIGPDAPMRIITPGAPLAPGPFKGSLLAGSLTKRPATLPSRGVRATPMQRAAPGSRTYSVPAFRFDGTQQAAYKALAQRTNPRLADNMADYIAESILVAAQNNSLDPRFLAAIVKVESSFDPYCLSSAGAMGLGQLMPFNLRPLGVGNAWDAAQNLQGAARLLRQNLDTFAAQPNGTLLAVAAYHAGVGAVKRAGKQVPPRPATQKYVWKVYYAYRALAPELFQ